MGAGQGLCCQGVVKGFKITYPFFRDLSIVPTYFKPARGGAFRLHLPHNNTGQSLERIRVLLPLESGRRTWNVFYEITNSHYLFALKMVADAGFEPASPNGREILSLVCIPVPPISHFIIPII